MSKIIRAMNAMLENNKLITDVIKRNNEYFFIYNSRYKWSIVKNADGDIHLYMYPGDEKLSQIAALSPEEFSDYDKFVTYSTKDFNNYEEALQTFEALYGAVTEKLLGVDKILDEIIEGDIPF